MKTTLHAQVRLTIVRQVEFEADTKLSVAEIDEITKRQAIQEYGEFDEIDVEDWSGSPISSEHG